MTELIIEFIMVEDGNLFNDGTPVKWFLTKEKEEDRNKAIKNGQSKIDDGKISIMLDDEDWPKFKSFLEFKEVYFHYEIGNVKGLGNKIAQIQKDKVRKIRFNVKDSGIKTTREILLEINNSKNWDWIIWETEGNGSPKYQRGGKTRKLGLYKVNYDQLRKAGENKWQEQFKDEMVLGGGWVKVAVLESLDYSEHKNLIKTFLPCFEIEGKKLKEPPERANVNRPTAVPNQVKPVAVGKSVPAKTNSNALDCPPPYIIMPFNYDDNGARWSRAIGKDLNSEVFEKAKANRLDHELSRWATASRSTITAFPKPPDEFWNKSAVENKWPLRPRPYDGLDKAPYYPKAWKNQIIGPKDGEILCEYQKKADDDVKYYSVKTGVEFVSTVSQFKNDKDLLEENSIHAMRRSNLIHVTRKRVGEEKFKARYQLEILSILLKRDPVTAEKNQTKLSRLTSIPPDQRTDTQNGELKELRLPNSFDGIQVREIGDAGQGEEVWFPALAIPTHGKAFFVNWAHNGRDPDLGKGPDEKLEWVEFWKKNYAIPMGEAKGEMLLYFGMQHMTSNAQNFLIVFDRKKGGTNGRLKHLILRDIGDTLYNDYIFEALKGLDDAKLLEEEFNLEKNDEFGVTLGSELGSYQMPRMLRIGASIVFLFGPFIEGDIAANPSCYRILADWCISHNRAFIDYMKRTIGYNKEWNKGKYAISDDLEIKLSKHSELHKDNVKKYKDHIVPGVEKLNSTTRWKLIENFEEKCNSIPLVRPLDKSAHDMIMQLVNAHEVLICSEVQEYIRSAAGKEAIKKMHRKSASSATSV